MDLESCNSHKIKNENFTSASYMLPINKEMELNNKSLRKINSLNNEAICNI